MIQLWIPLSTAKSVVVDAIKDSVIRLSNADTELPALRKLSQNRWYKIVRSQFGHVT